VVVDRNRVAILQSAAAVELFKSDRRTGKTYWKLQRHADRLAGAYSYNGKPVRVASHSDGIGVLERDHGGNTGVYASLGKRMLRK